VTGKKKTKDGAVETEKGVDKSAGVVPSKEEEDHAPADLDVNPEQVCLSCLT
jgi:hypothetical protein